MLSDVDIKKKINDKSIFIYPFSERNLEGAGVYVTASKFAWSLRTKEKICDEYGNIRIPMNDTAMIVSEEVISLDWRTAGICLSRVGMVFRGLRHAETPLKPGFSGRLVLAIYNHTDEEVKINIGDKIAVVVFYELRRGLTNRLEGTGHPTFALAKVVKMDLEDRNMILDNHKEFRGYKEHLKNKDKWQWKRYVSSALMLIVAVIFFLIGVFFLPEHKELFCDLGLACFAVSVGTFVKNN